MSTQKMLSFQHAFSTNCLYHSIYHVYLNAYTVLFQLEVNPPFFMPSHYIMHHASASLFHLFSLVNLIMNHQQKLHKHILMLHNSLTQCDVMLNAMEGSKCFPSFLSILIFSQLVQCFIDYEKRGNERI